MLNVHFQLCYTKQPGEQLRVSIFQGDDHSVPMQELCLDWHGHTQLCLNKGDAMPGITYTYGGDLSKNNHIYYVPVENDCDHIYVYDDWPYQNHLWRSPIVQSLYRTHECVKTTNIYQQKQLNIHFSVQVPVIDPGKGVYLLGNLEQLGAWDEENKIRLHNTVGNTFESLFITLPNQCTVIQFKFIICDPVDGPVVYEDGQNRNIEITQPVNQLVQIHAFFRYRFLAIPRLFGVKVDLTKFVRGNQFAHADLYDLLELGRFCVAAGIRILNIKNLFNADGFFNAQLLSLGLINDIDPGVLGQIRSKTQVSGLQKQLLLEQHYRAQFGRLEHKVAQFIKDHRDVMAYCVYRCLEADQLADGRGPPANGKSLQDTYDRLHQLDAARLTFGAYAQQELVRQLRFVCDRLHEWNLVIQTDIDYSGGKVDVESFRHFLGRSVKNGAVSCYLDRQTGQILETGLGMCSPGDDPWIDSFAWGFAAEYFDSIVLNDFELYYRAIVKAPDGWCATQHAAAVRPPCDADVRALTSAIFPATALACLDADIVQDLITAGVIRRAATSDEFFIQDGASVTLRKDQRLVAEQLLAQHQMLRHDPETGAYMPNYRFRQCHLYSQLDDNTRRAFDKYYDIYCHYTQQEEIKLRRDILANLKRYKVQFVLEEKFTKYDVMVDYDQIMLQKASHVDQVADTTLHYRWHYNYYTQLEFAQHPINRLWQNYAQIIGYLSSQLNRDNPDYFYSDIRLNIYNIVEKYLFADQVITILHLQDMLYLQNSVAEQGLDGARQPGSGLTSPSCTDEQSSTMSRTQVFHLPGMWNKELIDTIRQLLRRSGRLH